MLIVCFIVFALLIGAWIILPGASNMSHEEAVSYVPLDTPRETIAAQVS